MADEVESAMSEDLLHDEETEVWTMLQRGSARKYRPSMCGALIIHMRRGLSFESFAAECLVSPKTLAGWLKQHKDFAEAKDIGERYRLKTLELIGLKIATQGGGSAAAWKHIMNNAHGWSDHVTVTQDDESSNASGRDKRLSRIAELEAKLGRRK